MRCEFCRRPSDRPGTHTTATRAIAAVDELRDELRVVNEAAAQLGSTHFRASEFACPHCHVALVRPRLLTSLERLRFRIRQPIPIVSGYRCPVHNRAVDGARNSQHMYGAAADIPERLATIHDAELAGFTGIGSRGVWAVHVDVRDGGAARWRY